MSIKLANTFKVPIQYIFNNFILIKTVFYFKLDLVKILLLSEIKRNNGNKSKAAKEMGISREALRKKLLISRDVLDTLEEQFPEQEKKAA